MSRLFVVNSRRTLTVAAFALSLVASRPAAAAVVCVPDGGPPFCDASCTASDPTIQGAIDVAVAGDTVLVCPGVYPETVTPGHGGVVPGTAGIDINKSLTLKSTSGAAVTTIVNGGGPPGGHCLPTSCPGGPQQLVTLSASGITIDGFTILETDPTMNVITADGDAVSDNHVIKNNVITNPTFDDGNTGGGWGILLGGTGIDGADGNLFDANEISLNPDPTKNQFTFGIGLAGGGADSNDNNTISNNFIHDTGFGGFGDVNDTNTTVSGNRFLNNAKVGFQAFDTTGGKVMNNTFTNAGRAGLEIRNGATGVVVTNNCFSRNGSAPTTFSPCGGSCTVTPFGAIRIEDDSPGVTTGTMIHNNNFDGNNVPNGVTDNTAASTNTDGEAENNWWGCSAGPGNAGCDTVTANVDFTPFLSSPASATPCSPTTTSTTTTITTTTTTTTTPTCGNGVIDGGEQCDPALPPACPGSPGGAFLPCNPDCTCPAFCGNGIIDPGEQCDPSGSACGSPAGAFTCDAQCACVPAPTTTTTQPTVTTTSTSTTSSTQSTATTTSVTTTTATTTTTIPCVSSPEGAFCNDMIDNDCDGRVDCSDPDCFAAPCIGGTQNGQPCGTGALETACSTGGGSCPCSPIRKDPTTIAFGKNGKLDRLHSHGRVTIFGSPDVRGSEAGWLLDNARGRIFGVVLPANTLTANAAGTLFSYRNLNAKTQGGIYKAIIRVKGGTSYAYTVEAYGNMSAATDANMAIQFYMGNLATSAIHTEAWTRTKSGWRATGIGG